MKDIEKTLISYIRGQIDIDEVTQKLDQTLPQHPHLIQQLQSQLDKLFHDKSIPQDRYAALMNYLEKTQTGMGLIDLDLTLNPSAPSADEDATTVAPSPTPGDDDATIISTTQTSTDTGMNTSMTGGMGSGGGGSAGPIGPGFVLKERFRLESRLGEGGMGVVYKAVDLLKVEARDRNPYVAIKVLTESFKQHAESFIALQREASKAQRLAHPNIATVFDFDRDRGNVFMTMELLEGMPLNVYIKKLPPGGLPEAEAMRLIEGLGSGLAYAHKQGLVHSDFKPGNAFLIKDGTIKLLDFGIARAAKHQVEGSDHDREKTLFDPSSLGALTPAYATVEMFEGAEPDPSDDIYALACVAYELLTGQHPYNKQSAPKARELKLVPPPIPGLAKRQQKALNKALAYTRDQRTDTIEEFLDGLRRRKSYAKQIAAASIIGLSLAGYFGYVAYENYKLDLELQKLVTHIQSGDEQQIVPALSALRSYDKEIQTRVTADTRDEIIGYYSSKINDAINEQEGRYDFNSAEKYLKEAQLFYPDSATLNDTGERIANRKNTLLAALTEQYTQALENGLLLNVEGEDDITDALSILTKVDPDNPMLKDPRLAITYAEYAQKAVAGNDYELANNLLNTSSHYVKEDAQLQNLHDMVRFELSRIRAKAIMNDMQGVLDDLIAANSIAPFVEHKAKLIELAGYHIDDDRIRKLTANMQTQLDKALTQHTQGQSWEQAEQLLFNFSQALAPKYLVQKRTQLSELENNAGVREPMQNINSSKLADIQGKVEELLSKQTLGGENETDLLFSYKQIIALDTTKDITGQINLKLSAALKEHINKTLEAKRFKEAYRVNDLALAFLPHAPDYDTDKQRIQTAEAEYQKELAIKARLARVEGLKQTFLAQSRSNAVKDAIATFEQLKKDAPTDDPFINDEAPGILADAYQKLAESASNREKYDTALSLIEQGLKYAPGKASLLEAKKDVAKFVIVSSIQSKLFKAREKTGATLKGELSKLKSQYPDDYAKLEERLTKGVAAEIKARERKTLRLAHTLKDNALALMPGNNTIRNIRLKELPKPSKYAGKGMEQVNEGMLSQARATLKTALAKEPKHVEVAGFKKMLDEEIAKAEKAHKAYESALNSFKYAEARSHIDQAIALWKDNDSYKSDKKKLQAVIMQKEAGAKPCQENFAGYGKRSRATCIDIVATNKKAPTIVVVPAGGGHKSPYGISKYEISIGEFNLFCSNTKKCTLIKGDGKLPVSGISASMAEAYTKWLSDETGQTYRIPNPEEWRHAASAGGKEGNTDYNCLLRQGATILKGSSVLSAKSGKSNRWGLINYVGNVQELVRKSDGSYAAAGGSYQDAMSKCKVSLEKNHNGSADELTGFRVVRLL